MELYIAVINVQVNEAYMFYQIGPGNTSVSSSWFQNSCFYSLWRDYFSGRGLVKDSPPESAFTPEFCICQTVLHLPTACFALGAADPLHKAWKGRGRTWQLCCCWLIVLLSLPDAIWLLFGEILNFFSNHSLVNSGTIFFKCEMN